MKPRDYRECRGYRTPENYQAERDKDAGLASRGIVASVALDVAKMMKAG